MPLKIQIFSDLHVEHLTNINFLHKINVTAPYCALLGDIGNPYKKNYLNTLKFFSENFKRVFVLTGNHEYYQNIYCKTNEKINELIKDIPNVEFLNRTVIKLEDYIVLGCTLWSKIDLEHVRIISDTCNDYHQIHYMENEKIYRFNIGMQNLLHSKDVNWLNEQIAKYSEEKVIILTHHAPSYKNTWDSKYDGKPTNSVFASHLEYMFKDNVKLWCYGHTHYCNDQMINGIRLFSNQYGYRNENLKFGDGLVELV